MTGDLRAVLDAVLESAKASGFKQATERAADERAGELERARLLATERGIPSRLTSLVIETPEQTDAVRSVGRWFRGTQTAIVLSGSVGVGKSVAAARAVFRAPPSGAPAVFLNAERFIASSNGRDARERRDAQRAERSVLLALDDLGVEYLDPRGFNLARICYLLEQRLDDERRTIVTTNLDRAAFGSRYGARVVSRLAECGAWVDVTGPDQRIKT